MRWVILFLLFTFPAAAATATGPDTFRMDDGRIIRLQNIKGVGAEAKAALNTLLAEGDLNIGEGTPDRYGRLYAAASIRGKDGQRTDIASALVTQGLAFVLPLSDDAPDLPTLMRAEQEARTRRAGIWANPAWGDHDAGRPETIPMGTFAFVRGKVLKAMRVKNKAYLNFGDDWHTDFTVTIAAHDLHAFVKAGKDPEDLEGKTVRVRGWIVGEGGPMIHATTPWQINLAGDR